MSTYDHTRQRVALVALLAIAAWLRLSGLDWDSGHHLHPDERFLTTVATDVRIPSGIGQYFDTARSPLNPANVGQKYFTYGTLPLFLVRAIAELVGAGTYDRVYLVGRTMAALFDLGTILLAYRLALLLAGPAAALGAVALLSFSVLSIQHAHFFVVDAFATFFATLSMLMLVKVMLDGRPIVHLLFGVALGLTLACRINLVVLVLLYPAALLYLRARQAAGWSRLAAGAALAGIGAAAAFRCLQPYAFAGPTVFDLSLAQDFVATMRTIGAFSTGAADFPPSVQWIGRTPVLFPGWNLFVWALGPAWGITAIAATIWCLVRGHKNRGMEGGAGRIAVLWVPLLFFFHGTQFVATLRYFLPIVPILAVATAWMCAHASLSRRVRTAFFGSVVAATAVWALAFTSVYQRPHSRLAASEWIYDNVPAGATIATEHWDDALPLGIGRDVASIYEHAELKLYEEENESKRQDLIAALDAADVIVLSSNRLYRSIPRAPWRYPVARRYYELLFSGDLGFRLERVFTSYPRLGPLEIPDDDAEEALTVYDHPKVLIFRKSESYAHDRVASLLGAVSLSGVVRIPPGEQSALYRRVRPTEVTLAGERAARSAVPAQEGGSLGALARWLLTFELLSLAIFPLLFRPFAMTADRGYGLAKLLAWLAPGTLVWMLAWSGVAPHTPATARFVAAAIVTGGAWAAWRNRRELRHVVADRDRRRTILALEGGFLGAFALFALMRAFNPAIAWGEKPMDFAILNAFLRSPGVPPADPWFAGDTLNYFYFGHALTGVFANLAGVSAAFAFNLAIPTIAALLGTAAFLVVRQISGRVTVAIGGALVTVLAGNFAGPRLLMGSGAPAIGFDYFWATSRVVTGTINEFPFWSLAFADLHAHVLAMPFEAALLYVGALWIARGPAGERVPPPVLLLLAAWLVGAVAVTSSWSVPTVVALQLGFLVTAWRGHGSGAVGLARAVALWLGVAVVARLVFWPFWSHYTAPTSNWGWVTSERAGVVDMVTVFGVLFVLAAPALLTSLVQRVTPRRRLAVVTAGLLLAVAATFLRSAACGIFVGIACLAAVTWWVEEEGPVRTGALLVAAAAGIGAVTEVVFVWDRMNTVFKFYLQMWLLLACGGTVLGWDLLRRTAGRRRFVAAAAFALVLGAGLFTSVTGAAGLLREPRVPSVVPTLDGMAYLDRDGQSEHEAFAWLNRNVAGIPVVLEAHGASYQEFSRVSMNTGLPTVVGWEYHLIQQSRARDDIETRAAEVTELYDTTDLGRAEQLLRKYHIDLVFVGPLERRTYASEGLAKFDRWPLVQRVFADRGVTIYATPGQRASVKTWIAPVPRAVSAPNLREARGIARAADGTFFVADFGNRRVRRVDADTVKLAEFGLEGDGPAEFRDPCGIAIADDGALYVADTWNHRIQKLTPEGRQLAEWRADMFGPRGVALAKDGSLFVTDTGNHRVIRFAPDGTPRVVVDKPALENPVGIAIDAGGDVIVADTGHRRVAVFSQEGQLIREWPIDGWTDAALREPYLAVGPDGVAWVSDPSGKRVLLFDRSGAPLGEASPSRALELPLGIVVIGPREAVVIDGRTNRLVALRRP